MNSATSNITSPKSGYLPSLDGWRALAVISVIAYHDRLYRFGPINDGWVHSQGLLGVDLFFAISGILICSRLLDEEEKVGTISLRDFYLRRTFRIVPPMLAFLGVAGALGLLRVIHVGLTSWFASLLFFNNYYFAYRLDVTWSLYTNHFWSLAVEEHFYLILPALLIFWPKSRARLLGFLTLLCFLWLLAYAAIERHNVWVSYGYSRTDLRLYELFFPALLAVLLRRNKFRERCRRFCRPLIVIPIMLASGFFGFHVAHQFTHAFTYNVLAPKVLVPFGFPFLILCTMLNPESRACRFLEWKPLRALGRISYSFYLWQQLFFIGQNHAAHGLLALFQTAPWNLLTTLTIASLSYFILERPFIRLGHRLAPPATPGHSDLAIAHNKPPLSASSTIVDFVGKYNRIVAE